MARGTGSSGSLIVFLLSGLLTLCLLAVPAAAQTAQPVAGVVTDSQGGVLPTAQVELIGANGAIVASTISDTNGNFRFEQVAPGSYEVRVSFDGFDTRTAKVTVAGPRPPAALRMVLPLASMKQEVTVSGGALQADTSAGNNLNAIVVGQEELAEMPAFDQDYVGTLSRFLDDGSLGTDGASLIVDGMEAGSLGVSPSAVQQIKINQDPYAAEFSRPGRGRIEVITKAGAQAFHGTGNIIFRDAALNARDPFATDKPNNQRRIFEGYLGGPIGDGKNTSFVLSSHRREVDRESVVFAAGLDGPIQDNITSPMRETLFSGSVSHQRSEATTMTFRVSREQQKQTNSRVGGLTLPEAAASYEEHETNLVYTQNSTLTPTLLHQTRLRYGQEYENTISNSAAPRIVVQGAFTGGGAQADLLRTEHHATLTDSLIWSHGLHTVKGGINVPDWSRRGFDDATNFGGTFYFSNLQQYALGQPYAFIQQQGNGNLVFLEKVLGAFVQDEMAFNRNVTLSLGVRYDWQNYFGDANNVSPRASIAWAPAALKGSIVRGGAGVFYDRTGAGPIADLLQSRDGRLLRFVLNDPGYPNPLGPGQSLDAQPRSVVQLAPDINIPSHLQYSLGIERQLGKAVVSVTYIGLRGSNLFLSRDINAPLPPLYEARPDSEFGVIRQIESTGRSQSNSLQFTFRGKATRFFSGQMQYTLADAKNDTGGIGWYPANDYDLSGEYARADYSQRHRFDAMGTFRLGEATRFGMAVSLYSGRPYTLLAGQDLYNNGRGNARPDGVGRNTLDGPGFADVDLRVSRDLMVRKRAKGDESTTVTVGLDAFNIFNHTNYSSYIGTINSPLFGRATSAQAPRRLQLSLRARF